MIDNTLIENALALTGKKLYEMNRWYSWEYEVEYKFCIAEFCYYLLSPEFIEKYVWYHIDKPASEFHSKKYEYEVCIEIWASITTYQSGNEKPLIELLQKI